MHKIKKRSCGIHDGSFHADEVTACALLLLCNLIDKDNIHRTRDPTSLSLCEYVCDVGGVYDPTKKRFDHHQVEYTGELSSAGMILAYLRDKQYIEEELYHFFQENLVWGVDAHDNGKEVGKGVCTFSHIVSNFLPVSYNASYKEYHHRFFEALDFAYQQLQFLQQRFQYIKSCRKKVKHCMDLSEELLLFSESLPWLENFFFLGGEKHPAKFVIMPTGNHWKLRGIPPSFDRKMEVRKPLPSSWAGLHDEDLKKITNIPGAIFCHKEKFISIWETKEDALQAYSLALQEKT